MLHKDVAVANGIHLIQSWEVANAAALNALVPVAADVGKVAYQADTREFYVLANNVGPVWKNISSTSSESSGTFIPTIFGATTAGVHTYSIQAGFYRKIGSLVHVQGRIVMTAKDAAMSGAARIGGLPFTSLATAESYGAASLAFHNFITHTGMLTALVEVNNTRLNLYSSASGVSAVSLDSSGIAANSALIFAATYIAAP